MMYSFEFNIPVTHLSLTGHFPGNPVVPGVVIIDEVINGIKAQQPATKIDLVSTVKFLRPLKAGATVNVIVEEKKSDLLKFVCEVDQMMVANGQLLIQQAN